MCSFRPDTHDTRWCIVHGAYDFILSECLKISQSCFMHLWVAYSRPPVYTVGDSYDTYEIVYKMKDCPRRVCRYICINGGGWCLTVWLAIIGFRETSDRSRVASPLLRLFSRYSITYWTIRIHLMQGLRMLTDIVAATVTRSCHTPIY